MLFKKKSENSPKKEKAAKQPAEKQPSPYLSEKECKELQAQGWIRVLITFEIVGKPREHVEQTLKAYLINIKQDERIKSINEEYAEPLEQDEGLFSAFCEFEAMVQDLEVLTWLSINFMPASIEVLEPEKLTIEARELNNWYNDLISKLHEVSTSLREQTAVAQHLTEGMNALIKNAILAALRSGPKRDEELERILGIPKAQLAPFAQHLVKKGEIITEDGAYRLR